MEHNSILANQYEFIEVGKLQSVYDISEIWDKPDKVYRHFRGGEKEKQMARYFILMKMDILLE